MKLGAIGALGGASLIAMALVLTPALAASSSKAKRAKPALSLGSGAASSFTPANADPRLAAAFARRNLQSGGFQFTPASSSANKAKSIRVAVRARPVGAAAGSVRPTGASGSPITAITPAAYNLGVAVGWKSFAISGDVASVRNGAVPGERKAAEVGVSYSLKKFTGKVQVGAERAEGTQRMIGPDDSYLVDVGGSYSIARNVAVTGGVRYKIDRERLEPMADARRDSQAVYIGTAFRF